MPLVSISLLKGKSREHIRAVADGVHQALVETYGVPIDDRFQLIHQPGDDCPIASNVTTLAQPNIGHSLGVHIDKYALCNLGSRTNFGTNQ